MSLPSEFLQTPQQQQQQQLEWLFGTCLSGQKLKTQYVKCESTVYYFFKHHAQIFLTGNGVFDGLDWYVCDCACMHPSRAVQGQWRTTDHHAVRQLSCGKDITHSRQWIYCCTGWRLDMTCRQQQAPLLHLNLHSDNNELHWHHDQQQDHHQHCSTATATTTTTIITIFRFSLTGPLYCLFFMPSPSDGQYITTYKTCKLKKVREIKTFYGC